MKKLLLLMLMAMIAGSAHAEKSHKAAVAKQLAKTKWQQQVKPADTTGHIQYRQRDVDPRLGQSMHVAPAPTAKQQ